MNKKDIDKIRIKLDYTNTSINEKILLSRYYVSRLEDLPEIIPYREVSDLLDTLIKRVKRERARFEYRAKYDKRHLARHVLR